MSRVGGGFNVKGTYSTLNTVQYGYKNITPYLVAIFI